MSDVRFFENVFDERFCTFLLNDAQDRLRDSTQFRRSNFHWQPEIRKSSGVVLVRDYDETLSALILQQLLDRSLIEHLDYNVMNYAWTRFSFIPWHKDGGDRVAMTIYLNRDWDEDWGGLFLYRAADREIRGIAPRFNCAVRNSANLEHSTTPVAVDAPDPRFTIQLFSRVPKNEPRQGPNGEMSDPRESGL